MFVDQLAGEHTISQQVYTLLKEAGIGSYEEMYAVMSQFPSIARDRSLNLPFLSNIAATGVTPQVRASILSFTKAPRQFAKGAFSPPLSQAGNGYQQPPALRVTSALPAGQWNKLVHPLSSPVRDQGDRSTCVAHAVVACAERHFSHPDLSEQFLYWAAKIHGGDLFPEEGGTWLRSAKNALTGIGLCEEVLWPYDRSLDAGNETHQISGTAPSASALADGLNRSHTASYYQETSRLGTGKAALLMQHLVKGPVAVGYSGPS